jgi:two-component system, sensor histidine kinase
MSLILVLDDRATERELLSTVLGHLGHTVLQASTGEQALEIARANPPELIIADLMMSGMNGYEFVRELRADSTVGETKVVFCTAAYDEHEVRNLAESCGVSHTLIKPCEPDEIIRVVDEALALDGVSPAPLLSGSFDQEQLRVLNAKLVQKVDELETLSREQRQLHEDRKRALTQALEASRLKSEFMANISHEIRTPLNGIVGMTELLRGSSLDSVQLEYADALAASNTAMLAVVDDILDYSKLEAKHLILDLADFDLRRVVGEACAVFDGPASEKGLQISQYVDSTVPVTVTGDELRLRQILLNLLSNAVKFTASGEIMVQVVSNDGKVIRFEVADDGIGIDVNQTTQLFEAFVQADGSTTRNYGGTGIGLTIARELVHLMSGEIGAASREPRGSVFWFTAALPAAAMVDEEGLRHVQPTRGVEDAGTFGSDARPLVLIVEDDAISRVVAKAALERRGLLTQMAEDGREAVEMAGANTYAAIFMDCQMPNLDGYEATRQIRKAEQGHHTPIIAMTAHAMQGDKERCLASGMDEYISKPIQARALDAAVHQWLSLNGARQPPVLGAAEDTPAAER